MATSGSTDFTQTRDQIITRALRIIGAIGQGETPEASAVSEASTTLNVILKALAADGMPLWAIKEYTVTPLASTSSYTLSAPAPLKVLNAWYRDGDGHDTPLLLSTEQDYKRLTNKTSEGTPNTFFYKTPGADNTGTLYLYLTPDTTFVSDHTIYLWGQRPFEDMDAASDNLDFPIYWINAITWILAAELAFEYGVGLSERGMIVKRAAEHKMDALGFGTEEGSLFLQPAADWSYYG